MAVDRDFIVELSVVVQRDVFDDLRLVADLDGLRPWILNKRNSETIAGLAGSPDTENWVGLQIEVFATTTQFKGETVPCVRVRAPRATRETNQHPPEFGRDAGSGG